jgi:uncharacterized glyoxalase superfamily protein PhnB
MLPANRSIPGCVIIPELAYDDVRQAIVWLSVAFGFTLRLEIGNHRAQLAFGEGAIVVTQQPRTATGAAPERQHAVMMRVENLDAHHARAVQHGAKIVHPPADHLYGERQYTAEDPGGHVWTFSQTIADSDPASWGGKLHPSAR